MATLHPRNDLKLKFLSLTTTVKELVKSIEKVVDAEEVPAKVIDQVCNLTLGLKTYISTCENEIVTAMGGKIPHDCRINALQQSTGIVVIDDDHTIQLPTYATDMLGWTPGDRLQWEVKDENTTVIRKLAE